VPRADLLLQAQRLAQGHLAECALDRCGSDVQAAAALLGIDAKELADLQNLPDLKSPRREPAPAPPATDTPDA